MNKKTKKTYRVLGKLIKRLTKLTYELQGEIYSKCNFVEDKNQDARIALMGFIRGELISTYFQYLNLLNLDIEPTKKLDFLRITLGEVSVPDDGMINLLTSHLRRNFTTNIYSHLESGNRKFYQGGNFNDYKSRFESTQVNGFEILRHLRNSMHNNGLFLPYDRNDFKCTYRGYEVEYIYGGFVTTNYMFIYWIVRDSLMLFKEMALDNLDSNPSFVPIIQDYNIEKYFNKENVL
ncbi:hypothetical protein PG911_03640 [Tenacibaculum ovolyticum]|uniref:hypothetical protein n=1 Tax=Tenacibaculum ovolyticum TaxID=104270 RepID=UPI0022F3BA06|nr:hypothetical protein [Tenacibaculum ovolyticum]WBX77366.1 hypothetical protein PG911_03640 [Tenacibaculum ovolyticum]